MEREFNKSSEKPRIIVMIGPPGVGKNTIADKINQLGRFSCFDGDAFISPTGIKRLQSNLWDDTDRRNYLREIATFLSQLTLRGKRVIGVDAMTT